jgi:hypothetical protein
LIYIPCVKTNLRGRRIIRTIIHEGR